MPVGVTLMVADAGSSYFSAPFSRGGAAGTFALDVMINQGAATLNVDVEHKNSSDTTWSSAGSFTAWSGTDGTKTKTVENLKEMVRLKYDVTGDGGDFVHIFVYAPTWEEK